MQTFNKWGIICIKSINFKVWAMFSIKNIKRAYTLAEVIIVMLIIAVVVSISIKLAKTKLEHITSYTYYSAFSVVRNVTAEMLNDFNAEDENYISHEGLLTRLFMPKAFGEQYCLAVDSNNCYLYKQVRAMDIFEKYCGVVGSKDNCNITLNTETIKKFAEETFGFTPENKFGEFSTVINSLSAYEEKIGRRACAWYKPQNECLDNYYTGIYNHGACFGLSHGNWVGASTCVMDDFDYVFFYRVDLEKPPLKPDPDLPDQPSCTPKPCTGGNVFDDTVGVCDCVCKTEPPETIPCGKEWSDSQCQLVDKSDFPPTCPAGQVFDKSDSVCGCKPIKPSIPIKGANYCKLFVSYSNTSQLQTECAGDSVSSDTTEFAGLNPDIILRNGMRLYNVSQNPVKIPILTGNSKGNAYTYKNDANEDVTIDLDEYGYILYVDIDGERNGNGVLWEDVYPFYVTLSGMTVPAFKTGDVESYGGGNKLYLQVSLQDEYLNNSGRHIDWLLKSKPFRESACKSGYLSANSNYCKASPAITTLAQCGLEGHDCRLKYVSPSKLFK